ncbi:unnamed protein product [Nyctereutes procyonoides]|uniref:(raccoon dog) hypothetical protein n=1 Tax=Nyctereutes procyonoides TaxID=34880 RepID=A0A811ZMZ5_NYCPR|nr:unnamed protein product [Nyctereutes procyonoides]
MITNTWSAKLDIAFPLRKHRHSNSTKLWGQATPFQSSAGQLESGAQEEIAPGDIKYLLEPLSKVPLQTQPTGYFSQSYKPQWPPFKPVTYHGKKSSHSGDYHMITTHQISFQNPLLGQSMFPVHIQGRKIAPVVRPGYMEYISQYQRNFQASGWNQVLRMDPNKNNQGIKQEMTILGRKSTAKFDGDTVTRMPYLPPPKAQVKRVKGKCPSSTLRRFFQDGRTQPRVGCGDPYHRSHEKLPAPTENQTTPRISYMPLFSERLNLCKPKVNSIKWEPNTISLQSKGKHSGQSSYLKASSRSIYGNKTQNSQI